MKYKINNKIIKALTVLDAINQYNVRYNDERLSPSTYRALKALGVQPSQWRQMSQEQASEYISKRKNATVAKSAENKEKSNSQKTSKITNFIKENSHSRYDKVGDPDGYKLYIPDKDDYQKVIDILRKQGFEPEGISNRGELYYDKKENIAKKAQIVEKRKKIRSQSLTEINNAQSIDELAASKYSDTEKRSMKHSLKSLVDGSNTMLKSHLKNIAELLGADDGVEFEAFESIWTGRVMDVTASSKNLNNIARIAKVLNLAGVRDTPIELYKQGDNYKFKITANDE